MSKTSDRHAILVMAIVLEIADKYNLPPEELMKIAQETTKKEIT